MAEQWIEDGWKEFEQDVLVAAPDHPAVNALSKMSFFSGALWLMTIVEIRGRTSEGRSELHAEIAAHIRKLAGEQRQ